MAPGKGPVILQCIIGFEGGGSGTFVTNSSWKAFGADGYYGQTGSSGRNRAPQEHIVAAQWPGDWTAASFDDSAWPSATEQPGFGYTLGRKETLPLDFIPGVVPPVLAALPGNDDGDFFDFETYPWQVRQLRHQFDPPFFARVY